MAIFKRAGCPAEHLVIEALLTGVAAASLGGARGILPVQPADVHFYGDACLRTAVRRNCPTETIRLLLDHGADPSSEHSEPLRMAYQKGRHDLVRDFLMGRPSRSGAPASLANVADADHQILAEAVLGGDLETVRFLLLELPTPRRANPNARGGQLLAAACERGDLGIVRVFLDAGADVQLKDNAAIKAACRVLLRLDEVGTGTTPAKAGQPDIELDHPEADDETEETDLRRSTLERRRKKEKLDLEDVMMQIIANPVDTNLLKMLIAAGADPCAGNDIPFIAACMAADTAFMSELLEVGANPTARSNLALRLASAKGHLDIVKTLCQSHKANPDDADTDALVLAAENGRVEVVKYLLEEAGADIGAQDDAALRGASGFGHVKTVEYLLSVGADVHAGDDDALSRAASGGHAEVARVLLGAGADVLARGKRAIRDASRMGHVRVLEILEEAATAAGGKKKGRRKGVPGSNVLSGHWGSAKVVIPGLN
ncbi:ankyrin repeat-containing domain protein, partial [Zopfochytrium polystomum]